MTTLNYLNEPGVLWNLKVAVWGRSALPHQAAGGASGGPQFQRWASCRGGGGSSLAALERHHPQSAPL